MITWLLKFIKGFYYALRGIITAFRERNMKVHGLAAFLVVVAGLVCGLAEWEWFIVLVLIAAVWSAEMVNTSLEELANIIKDQEGLDYLATKNARDLAAGSVFVLAIVAAIIGLWIFLPKI